jgi:hypothetical protein
MHKLLAFAIAMAMAAVGAPARADQPVPGRWFQLNTSFGSNPCAAGVACVYRNVNTLHFVDTTGSDTALGAGGGSLGNYTATGNNLDVSVSGAAAIYNGNTNATSLTVGSASAMGPVLFNGGRLRMQQRAQSGAGLQALSVIGGGATSLTAATEYVNVNLQGNQTYQFAAGTVATERFNLIQAPTITGVSATANFTNIATLAIDAPPTAGTNAAFTSAWALWLQTGNLGFGPNAAIGLSSQAATNTTAFSINPNVADGASSVALNINNLTTLSNASAVLLQIQNNGTTRFKTLLNSTDGFILTDGGGSAKLALSTNAGAVFGYGGATFSAGSGSVTMGDGTGSLGMSAGNLTLTIIQGVPDADGTRDWGLTGTRWRTVAGKVVSAQHPAGNGTAPTKAAGACIGGTQTVTLDANATDAAGAITLTGTATGTATSTCATVTFNATWATAPHCQLAPANLAASALSGAAQLWIDSASTTTSVFLIKSNTALVAGTYIYNYDCYQ